MKKLFITFALFAALGLGACQESKDLRQVVVTKQQVILDVPEAFYNCPELKTFPDPRTLTDGQVASLLTTLVQNNQTCKSSINQIRVYLKNARVIQKKNAS